MFPYNNCMARTGRPPKKPDDILEARIEFRLLPEEKEQFEQAAQLADMKLSAWVRKRLLSVARREINKKGGRSGSRTPSA